MHNGVYDSLEEVMDFYNLGGGQGLGIGLPHQTLPFDNLQLKKRELKDIIAFMQTLTDTTGLTRKPAFLPTFEGQAEWNQRKLGGAY
jgi:cytochrome c peroxidase